MSEMTTIPPFLDGYNLEVNWGDLVDVYKQNQLGKWWLIDHSFAEQTFLQLSPGNSLEGFPKAKCRYVPIIGDGKWKDTLIPEPIEGAMLVVFSKSGKSIFVSHKEADGTLKWWCNEERTFLNRKFFHWENTRWTLLSIPQ
jgi:hypothetical protein